MFGSFILASHAWMFDKYGGYPFLNLVLTLYSWSLFAIFSLSVQAVLCRCVRSDAPVKIAQVLKLSTVPSKVGVVFTPLPYLKQWQRVTFHIIHVVERTQTWENSKYIYMHVHMHPCVYDIAAAMTWVPVYHWFLHIMTAMTGGKPKQMAVVLFEYRPEQPDELELMEGDEVEIVKMVSLGLLMLSFC